MKMRCKGQFNTKHLKRKKTYNYMMPGLFLLKLDKKGKPVIVPYPIKVPRKAIDEMIHSKRSRRLNI